MQDDFHYAVSFHSLVLMVLLVLALSFLYFFSAIAGGGLDLLTINFFPLNLLSMVFKVTLPIILLVQLIFWFWAKSRQAYWIFIPEWMADIAIAVSLFIFFLIFLGSYSLVILIIAIPLEILYYRKAITVVKEPFFTLVNKFVKR